MTTENFLPYARQSINGDDITAVSESLTGMTITRGKNVDDFENAVAEYCGAAYGVAFNTGTTALMAACHVAGVGPHDRVLTTPNTFVATVGAGLSCQATPVFIDIDSASGNIDLEQLALNMSPFSTQGRPVVMPVHYAGIAVDMQSIDAMIVHPDTIVIEDAAQALGSVYPSGEKVGSCRYSDMTIFSFHPAKIVTTGEGGMVMTNDADLYHKLRRYRNNGIEREQKYLRGEAAPWYYECHEITGNFNFTDFQAALGISQMKRLDDSILKRRKLMKYYRELLADIPHLRFFSDCYDDLTAFHLCVVQIDFSAYQTSRTAVIEKLKEQGVGSQLHYIPVYKHPIFQDRMGDISAYFPKMEMHYAQALSIPLYNALETEDVQRIVSALKTSLGSKG